MFAENMERSLLQMRGLSFEIPNQYGRYLFDILEGIDLKSYFWRHGGGEAYYIEDGTLGSPLFPKPYFYTGEELYRTISARDYYVIFADLKAFLNETDVQEIATYEEFLASPCEFVLLVVDCAYVTIYAKNEQVLRRLYKEAVAAGYKNVAYMTDDNDDRTTLIAF
ncbi:MAG: DUF2691 family protein [Solibacillus sp.]